MLRRLHFFLSVSFCAIFTCYWITPLSQSQGSNHSLFLNGTSSYVDVPYNANLNITGALTMEAWVKTSSTAYQQVLERGDWWVAQDELRLGGGRGQGAHGHHAKLGFIRVLYR